MTSGMGTGGKPSGWRRLIRVVRRDPVEETDEELRFHLEMRVEDYLRQGMTEEEAQAAARTRLGDMEQVRRDVGKAAQVRTRVERRRERLGDLRQDLRYGSRMLFRAPTFTAMSALTLALGIGATTAIFSLVYTVLLSPLPYPDPGQLVRVWETSPQGDARNVVSSGNVTDWQDRMASFSVLGAHNSPASVTLTGDGDPIRVVAAVTQPQVFRALDVPPSLGRYFVDDDAGGSPVAVISHAFWQTRFGGDPTALGRDLVLNGSTLPIVGVMPPEFAFPSPDVDVWVPKQDATFDPTERTSHNYQALARLAPGATVESAQSELDAVVAGITREHPAEMTGWGARVVPLHQDMTREVKSLFWVLLGGVVVVLLIACANLANLLLARAVARQREMAVRGALGAGRGRILAQLLTESGLLALLGAAGAMGVAPLLLRVLKDAAPPGTPFLDGARIDLAMLAFTAGAAIGCAVLFGLAPAVRLSGASFESALRTGRDASPSGHTRLRSGLLVAQVALTVVLLVGAGLFVRSFRAMQNTELGFAPEGLVVMNVSLPNRGYPDTEAQAAFYTTLRERVAAIPGVAGAVGTTLPPGTGVGVTFSFSIDGRQASNPSGREDDESLHAVSPGYFDLLGRRMVEGRPFNSADRAESAPVVILNESLARKHWPEGGAVGQRIAFRADVTPWREVVGVVQDARLESPDVAPVPSLYIPFAQKTWDWMAWTGIVARTSAGADATELSGAMRRALLALDPDLPPQSTTTVEAAFRRNTAERSFAMTLVGGFGGLALVLSIVGLYGLISYSVAQQRREIGVRIALGAASGVVVRSVLRRSILLTLLGVAGGIAGAAGSSRVIENLLYGVSATDGTTYLGTVGLVVAVSIVTASLPALRAARTDPITALRSD